ncbi:hypothetical protein DIT72_07235 [Marinobacter orientalis]|nr:hypothetical protein DIT72_07235 [Marinobacter orientalis]
MTRKSCCTPSSEAPSGTELPGSEGKTLRKTIWPALYYSLFTGLIALAASCLPGVTDPLKGAS